MSDQDPQPQYPKYPGEGGETFSAGQPPAEYPSATQPEPERPQSIRTAVRLMQVGAGLSALGTIVSIATIGSLKDSIEDSLRDSDPNVSQSTVDAAYSVAIVAGVIGGIIAVLLWLWMAWKNGQGRSWARVVATVFGGLNLLSTLFSLASPQADGFTISFSLINLVLAGAILVFLWRKESSAYYDSVSQRR
ncbi:hypothetical protein [Aeromicrobium terrae]|uniref:Uncharacterized protein n=1 Tax=Aeromicrobium terrae TaxID=2498846 RepID=A0A5C8NLD1_9ACTN|nr:hypothetical protein [Aeromicrobium terrae]TXL62058.1 hypothetical protein FHP06_04925 [Aeromicrobium terrae]